MNPYEEEAARLANRPKGGGGGDFTFVTLDKPSSVGQKTQTRLRVIPRLPIVQMPTGPAPDTANPFVKFWIRVVQHNLKIDGQNKVLISPDDIDDPNWKNSITDPLLILRKELYDAKGGGYEDVAKNLKPRSRYFVNVINMDKPQAHWEDDGSGGHVIKPHVWAYSSTVQSSLIDICTTVGPIEDIGTGRVIVLTTEKKGPRAMDVRYSVIAMDPTPVPAELMPIVHQAHDLEGLRKPASLDELRNAAAQIDPRVGTGASVGWTPPPQATGYAPPVAAHGDGGGAPQMAPTPPMNGGAPPQMAPPASAAMYHYMSPAGVQSQGLTGAQVAQQLVAPGTHQVWTDGMAAWADARTVPAIAALVAPGPAPAPPPAAAPPQAVVPAPPAGPPGPVPQGGYGTQAAPPPAVAPLPGPPAAAPPPPVVPGPPAGNPVATPPPPPPGPPTGRAF